MIPRTFRIEGDVMIVEVRWRHLERQYIHRAGPSRGGLAAWCGVTSSVASPMVWYGMVWYGTVWLSTLTLCTLERALKKNQKLTPPPMGAYLFVWTTRRQRLGHDCCMARGLLVGACYSKTGQAPRPQRHGNFTCIE